MGVNVAVLDEIRSRITTAMGGGGDLAAVKRFMIGAREEARKHNDLPVINCRFVRGSEQPDFPNKARYDEMEIELSLIHTKLINSYSTLFQTSDQTGGLYLFEKMRNVLDKNTSGTPDNTFNSTVAFDKFVDYEIDESNDVVEFILRLRLKTKSFIAGGR